MKQIIMVVMVSVIFSVKWQDNKTGVEEKKDAFWQRVWPSDAPAETCMDGGGREHPLRGKGSATWFNYGGAGDWKVFNVEPKIPVLLIPGGDSCPGCCLGHLKFKILEEDQDDWSEELNYEGPSWHGVKPDDEPGERYLFYTPKAKRLRIECTGGGFYIRIYQLKKIVKKEEPAKLKEEINNLIKLLGDKDWQKREKANERLLEIGEPALSALEEAQKSKDPEVKWRVENIISEIKEKISTASDEGLLVDAVKERVKVLVTSLVPLIEKANDKDNSEPYQSLIIMGEYAVDELGEKLDNPDVETRRAIVSILGEIGSIKATPYLIEALKDKNISKDSQTVLHKITGQDFGEDTKKWQEWWNSNRK